MCIVLHRKYNESLQATPDKRIDDHNRAVRALAKEEKRRKEQEEMQKTQQAAQGEGSTVPQGEAVGSAEEREGSGQTAVEDQAPKASKQPEMPTVTLPTIEVTAPKMGDAVEDIAREKNRPKTDNSRVVQNKELVVTLQNDSIFTISICIRSFAPFKSFGPGNVWHGDNRGFSLSRNASYRTSATIKYDTETFNPENSLGIFY